MLQHLILHRSVIKSSLCTVTWFLLQSLSQWWPPSRDKSTHSPFLWSYLYHMLSRQRNGCYKQTKNSQQTAVSYFFTLWKMGCSVIFCFKVNYQRACHQDVCSFVIGKFYIIILWMIVVDKIFHWVSGYFAPIHTHENIHW